jgi:hypothetical protein
MIFVFHQLTDFADDLPFYDVFCGKSWELPWILGFGSISKQISIY